jgi:DNA-binding transcriptional LysR family regulator
VETAPRTGVVSTLLADAEYVCALPQGHRLAGRRQIDAADLDGEVFVGPMHDADALWFGIDEVLTTEAVKPRRQVETQHAFSTYAFVQAGLGLTSAPLFHQLGVRIRRFRPRLSVRFALLEPEIGPTPPAIADLRAGVMAAAEAVLARTLALADAP